MSNFKLFLAGGTALCLSMTAASAADDNEAFLDQIGQGNSAEITQSGDDNWAGSGIKPITQLGQRNILDIEQSGDGNQIGLQVNGFTGTSGVIQNRTGNDANSLGNRLIVLQSSDANIIGAVSQTGSTQGGGSRNDIEITQAGSGDHSINSITQAKRSSGANVLDIEQTGTNNKIDQVRQMNRIGGAAGNRNEATITQSGNSNGQSTLTGLTGLAAGSGATSSSVIQGNSTASDGALPTSFVAAYGSRAILNISGDANQFGVSQFGGYNTVGTLAISGDQNQVGTFQQGNNNTISVVNVSGMSNNIGMRQLGFSNLASVDVNGGNGNIAGTSQTGTSNNAMLSIMGDDNGGTALFSGVASGLGLTEGMVVQTGDDNMASLTVNGNNNLFAMLQVGNDNAMTGMQTGASNQAAVMQMGNSNVANFTQNGSGNNTAISQ